MLRICYCSKCLAYTAIFYCPKCRARTRCSDVADLWTDEDGQVGADDIPVLECDDCGVVAEVDELISDSPIEVRFSVICAPDV